MPSLRNYHWTEREREREREREKERERESVCVRERERESFKSRSTMEKSIFKSCLYFTPGSKIVTF